MKIEELLKEDLEKNSFSKKLKEKESALVQLGAPKDEFKGHVERYKKLLDFDEQYQKLLKTLNDNKERDVDEYTSGRVAFFSTLERDLINALEKLDSAQPTNVNQVFTYFQAYIDERGFLVNITFRTPQNREVSSGKAFIDDVTQEVKTIIASIEGREEIDLSIFDEAKSAAESLISKQKTYEDAAKTAESWLKSEGKIATGSLQDASRFFSQKASEHEGFRKVYIWLLAGAILGVAASAILMWFAFSEKEFGLGTSLLKITSVAVLLYFSYFTVDIFSNERRLKETYSFKAVALRTMTELVNLFPDPEEKRLILSQGITVIFNEPSNKKNKIVHQKVVDDVVDIIKKKV